MLVNEIVRLFNSEGVPSPLATNKKLYKVKEKQKKEWQHTRIKKILRNEIYIGNMVQRKRVTKNPDEWVRVENTHNPIVTKELFYKVQKILDIRYENYKSKGKVPYEDDIFKGTVCCKCCGGKLRRKRYSNDRYMYCCTTNNRMGNGTCESVSINKNILINIVSKILENQYTILITKEKYNDTQEKKKSNFETVENLQVEIHKDKEFSRSLYENLIKELLTIDEYNLLKNTYQERIIVKTQKLKEIEEKNKQLSALKKDFEPFIKNKKLDEKLVDALIDKIYVSKGRIVEIEFKYNVKELREVYYE